MNTSTQLDLRCKARHGNSKVTREEWLTAARDTLVTKGVSDVKVLTLANQLGVARSSFYWYFANRSDLLDALLQEWEQRNTQCILEKCALPTDSIAQSVCHFFECFMDPRLFDQGLDFAVREWSRRDPAVREKIDEADRLRLDALREVFKGHGYGGDEADARARILYFMQLGYHALDINESMDTRVARIDSYLIGFTGRRAAPDLIEQFSHRARALAQGD
ncbi:TetR family transcriptional regulator [Roseobacter cerasinus]|uniref:TetR family transcriptional regulator n=1 Tax=Roseobacter cerasinus TaxID=2602289 RepID=A0A640VQU6_9RHOB|nr:TetR/AcrR family transcriptional regulator [Roseobacter cerasinus]GFE50778.1 TetR family transcriptional regulator [Roseobacter cerasinus]